MLFLEEIE